MSVVEGVDGRGDELAEVAVGEGVGEPDVAAAETKKDNVKVGVGVGSPIPGRAASDDIAPGNAGAPMADVMPTEVTKWALGSYSLGRLYCYYP